VAKPCVRVCTRVEVCVRVGWAGLAAWALTAPGLCAAVALSAQRPQALSPGAGPHIHAWAGLIGCACAGMEAGHGWLEPARGATLNTHLDPLEPLKAPDALRVTGSLG
jgi:hypothetical protein